MITEEEIKKLASLSRIEVSGEEVHELQRDMGAILGYVDQIKKSDKLVAEVSVKPKVYNIMRDDNNPHDPGVYTEKILKEVPDVENGYVKVKKIL